MTERSAVNGGGNPKQQRHLALALLGLKTPEASPTATGFPKLVDLMASAPGLSLPQGNMTANGSMLDADRVREQLHFLLQHPPDRRPPASAPLVSIAASSTSTAAMAAMAAPAPPAAAAASTGKPARPLAPKSRAGGSKASGDARSGCNCKRSRCLKLYCVCFTGKEMCTAACNCQLCHNNTDHESDRLKAIQAILERNPAAFEAKFAANQAKNQDTGAAPPTKLRHKRGCRCRKSGCLKKYCECFQASVKCGERCVCVDCKNVGPGAPPPGKQPPAKVSAAGATRAPPPPLTVLPQDNATQPLPAASLVPQLGMGGVGIAASPHLLGRKRARGPAQPASAKKQCTASRSPKPGGKAPKSPNRPVGPPVPGRALSMPLPSTLRDNARYSLMEAAEDLAWMKTGTPSPRKVVRGMSDGNLPANLIPLPPTSLDDMGGISAQDLSSLYALSSAATSVASSPIPGGAFSFLRASPLSTLLAAESQLTSGTPGSRPTPRAFFPALNSRGSFMQPLLSVESIPRASPYASWRAESEAFKRAAQAAASGTTATPLTLSPTLTVGTPSSMDLGLLDLNVTAQGDFNLEFDHGPLNATQPPAPREVSPYPNPKQVPASQRKPQKVDREEGEGIGSTDGSASSDSGDEVHGRKESVKHPLAVVEEHPQREMAAGAR